jgi:hypothetical protein
VQGGDGAVQGGEVAMKGSDTAAGWRLVGLPCKADRPHG